MLSLKNINSRQSQYYEKHNDNKFFTRLKAYNLLIFEYRCIFAQ